MGILYSDLNQYVTEVPGDRVFDLSSVYQAINNLISTRKRERLFRPDVGANIEHLLMEMIDSVTAASIYSMIVSSLKRDEPRIILNSALSDVYAEPDNHRYRITLAFTVKGLNESFDYSGYLYAKTGEA